MDKKISKKKLSLLAGKICLDIKFALLEGTTKKISKKKLSLLAGKLYLEKKVCAFEWCPVLSQKYTKSFGGKKSCIVPTVLTHQKSQCIFDFLY